MNNESLVSVIIPAFNCGSFILESIDSILSQSYSNLEILVCDDGSIDKTWQILNQIKDPRLRFFRNEKNLGVVPTKNKLLGEATGEFIVFQDADDCSHPRRVEKLVEQFRQDLQLDVCASGLLRSWPANEDLPSQYNSKYITLSDCLTLELMPGTVMMRKSLYNSVGGFSMVFNRLIGEDLYWVSTVAHRHKVLYIDLTLYYYRFNIHSLTNSFRNPAKLVAMELIKQLILQRMENAGDWITKGDSKSIQLFIGGKLKDPEFLTEQYRLAAARLRDGGHFFEAFQFILKAIWLRPGRAINYRTLRYVLMPFKV